MDTNDREDEDVVQSLAETLHKLQTWLNDLSGVTVYIEKLKRKNDMLRRERDEARDECNKIRRDLLLAEKAVNTVHLSSGANGSELPVKRFRLTWRDGTVKELTAASIDEAVCSCGKGSPYTWCIVVSNDKLNDSEVVRSNVLFGASVVHTDGFRSIQKVNADEDMMRVTLDMPKHTWLKLQKQLSPNAPPIG